MRRVALGLRSAFSVSSSTPRSPRLNFDRFAEGRSSGGRRAPNRAIDHRTMAIRSGSAHRSTEVPRIDSAGKSVLRSTTEFVRSAWNRCGAVGAKSAGLLGEFGCSCVVESCPGLNMRLRSRRLLACLTRSGGRASWGLDGDGAAAGARAKPACNPRVHDRTMRVCPALAR